MQTIGLMAIGFVVGVLVTALFGRRIAAAAVADAKAVAFDAGRTVNDAATRVRTVLTGVEARLHAKIDTLKADAAKDISKL